MNPARSYQHPNQGDYSEIVRGNVANIELGGIVEGRISFAEDAGIPREFIILLSFRDKGARYIVENPGLQHDVQQICESLSVDLKAIKLLFGPYQALLVCQALDYPVVPELLRSIKALGDMDAEVLLVFSPDEYSQLLAKTHAAAR